MSIPTLWRRAFKRSILVTVLLTGCAWNPFRARVTPPRELCDQCQALPQCQRDHVHVFMVNGLTICPHVYGSLNGIGNYVEELGLNRPRVATHYWRWTFQKEIRQIYECDPDARFVLVGYSIGGGVVQEIARTMTAEGIPIALVVFIDAHGICSDLDNRPSGVARTVNIISRSPILRGHAFPDADNYQVDTFSHLAAPRNLVSLETLARELVSVASGRVSLPPSSVRYEPNRRELPDELLPVSLKPR